MNHREQLQGPHVHGDIVVSRFEYLKDHHGTESIRNVLAALSEEDRLAFTGFDREGWYPFAALIRLDEKIAALYAGGDPILYERLGELSSHTRMAWLGEHASLVNVHGFLSRTAETHGRFHSFGAAEYRRIGFSEGELRFSGYATPSPVYCRSAIGYLKASLERLTGNAAAVEERSCQCRGDAACVFYMQWVMSRPEA